MRARELEVLTNDQVVGHLRQDNDLWEFEYTPGWATSPHGFDLSPALPRLAPPHPALHRDGATNRPVQWYFDNLLPEEALRTIIAREADIDADDSPGSTAPLRRPPPTRVVKHAGCTPLIPANC